MSDLSKLWCLGAPQVSERVMSDAERKAVRSDMRSSFARAFAWVVLGPLLPFALGIAWMEAGLWRPLGAVLLCASLPGTVIGILKCLDGYRRGRLLQREVLDPRLVVFEVSDAADQEDVARISASTPPKSGGLVFAVALATGRLRDVDGDKPARELLLAIQRITTEDAGTHRVMRSLTDEECQELLVLASGAWRYPLRSGAFFVLLGAVALIRGKPLSNQGTLQALYAAVVAATGVLFLLRIVRGLSRAARVRVDVRNGVALRVVLRSEEARTVCEILPASRLLWTLEGAPARWRTGALPSLAAAERQD